MNTFLYNTTFLITNSFHIYVIYCFMKLFFKEEELNKSSAIIFYSIQYIVSSIIYIFFSYPLLNLFSTIVLLFITSQSYHSKISRKIVATVLIFLTTFVSEAIVAFFTGITETSPFIKQQFGNIFSLIMVELVTFIIVKIVSRLLHLDYDLSVPWLFIITIIIVPIISIFFEMQIFMQSNVHMIIFALTLICVVTLNFIVFYLYDSLSKIYCEKIQKELSKKELHYYQKQAELIQKNSQEIKQLRHDMKNYTIALSELIKNNENEKALEYISSVSGVLEPTKIYCDTGILSIDSIVNYKFTIAEEMGISVDSEITIPYNLNLKSNDLVAILGNLLDNAIEASSKTEMKYIKFRASYDRGTVLIVLSNSYNGELKLEGKTYKTTKKYDTAIHGIGLKSIKSAVEKYNGEIKVTHTNTEFSVKILMFN